MESKIVLLLIFLGIICVGIVSAVIIAFIFALRKRTIVHIIHPNKFVTKHKFNGAMPKEFTIKNKTYIYDETKEFRRSFRHYIYYFYKNPYPVSFDEKNNFITTSEYNTTEINAILKSNLIEKLFKDSRQQEIMLYILIGIAVISIGVLAVGIISLIGDTSITSPENAEFIRNQVKIVLSGG